MKPRAAGYLLLLIMTLVACTGKTDRLLELKILSHYPSASGIEYRDHKVYIIGDDANYLLILDSSLRPVDSLRLYDFPGNRIPKAVKPDLEAITLLAGGKILLTGSGSAMPLRNVAWQIDLQNGQKDSIRLDSLYTGILRSGIRELNIEGLTAFPGGLIFANRGNKSYPLNHLIFTGTDPWNDSATAPVRTVPVSNGQDPSVFSGISGLAYVPQEDALLMTVSTEDTRNSMDDGAIGKSYLWIIRHISAKKEMTALRPDRIIELDALDPRFKGQKIESVCILGENSGQYTLLLAADNDNGSSTLFRLVVSKD